MKKPVKYEDVYKLRAEANKKGKTKATKQKAFEELLEEFKNGKKPVATKAKEVVKDLLS